MGNFRTHTLYRSTLASGAFVGAEAAVLAPRDVTHVPVSLDLSAGTGTFVVQGRISGSIQWVDLCTLDADGEGELVARFDYMRVNRTAATGATAQVSVGCNLKGTDAGTVELSGTAAATIDEADIVAGGKTIILTLSGTRWAAEPYFAAARQAIISGLDSAQSEALGWDAKVKALEVVSAVVRTSDSVVTITLTASATYNITAQETITATIPASALQSGIAKVASPTLVIATA